MSIFTRNGIYYTRFKVNGKEVVKSTKTRDRNLAMTVEANMEDKAIRRTSRKMTLSQAIERCYEERWFETKKGDETFNRAMTLLVYLGDVPLASITNEDIQGMRKAMLRKGRTPATINRHMSRLKTIMTMAMERWNVIDRTPFIPHSREVAGRIRTISKEEHKDITRVLISWGERGIAEFFHVLMDTGMRLSEALNIHSRDVDFDKNLIMVWKNKSNRPRSIPMTSLVRIILQARDSKDKMFDDLDYNRIQYIWTKVKRVLKIEDKDFVIHSFRHTYASRLVQAGYDLYKIKLLLGHSSIKVTERYAHLLPTSVLDASEVLEKFNVM